MILHYGTLSVGTRVAAEEHHLQRVKELQSRYPRSNIYAKWMLHLAKPEELDDEDAQVLLGELIEMYNIDLTNLSEFVVGKEWLIKVRAQLDKMNPNSDTHEILSNLHDYMIVQKPLKANGATTSKDFLSKKNKYSK